MDLLVQSIHDSFIEEVDNRVTNLDPIIILICNWGSIKNIPISRRLRMRYLALWKVCNFINIAARIE